MCCGDFLIRTCNTDPNEFRALRCSLATPRCEQCKTRTCTWPRPRDRLVRCSLTPVACCSQRYLILIRLSGLIDSRSLLSPFSGHHPTRGQAIITIMIVIHLLIIPDKLTIHPTCSFTTTQAPAPPTTPQLPLPETVLKLIRTITRLPGAYGPMVKHVLN